MATPRQGFVKEVVATSTGPSAVPFYVAPNQTNGIVLLWLVWTGTATISSGPTLNSVAMSSLGAAVSNGTSTAKRSGQWFWIKQSDIGATGDVNLDCTFSASNKWHAGLVAYDNVDQTTPNGTLASATSSGTVAAISCSPASAVGDLIVAGFGSGTGTPTADSGQLRLERMISNDTWGSVSTKPGEASSTTVGWTYTSTSAVSLVVAFALKGANASPSLAAPTATSNRSVILQSGPVNALATGTLWKIPLGSTTEEGSGAGLSTASPMSYSGAFGKYSVYVSANTCTQDSSITLYIAHTATTITITVPASTTGAFSDTAHTASVSAGDAVSHAVSPGNGSGTGSITILSYCIEFIPDDTSLAVTYMAAYSAGDSSAINTPTNLVTYHVPHGARTITNTSEAVAQARWPIDGTLTKAWAELYTISAGTRHTLDVKLGPRINGADGNGQWMQAPITADTITSFDAGTDSINRGDLIDYICALDASEPSGKTFGLETLGMSCTSSEKYFVLCSGKANGSGALNGSTTYYVCPSGEQSWVTTEAQASFVAPFDMTLFRFGAKVLSNTAASGTGNIDLYVRVNGANSALRLTVPRASDDMFVEDPFSSLEIVQGDVVSISCVTTGFSTGSIRFPVVILAATATPEVTLPTLVDVSGVGTAPTTATITVTSTGSGGTTLYLVAYDSALGAPSAAQIAAGTDINNNPATWDNGGAAWTGSGQQGSATGLTGGASYKTAAVVHDPVGGYSNVVVSAAFTTSTTVTATTSLSAAIQQAKALTASLSTAAQTTSTADSSTNLAVQAARTAQASLDLAVRHAVTGVAGVQAMVQAAGLQTTSLDAALQLARTAITALDLAVQAQGSATASVSAQVQATAQQSTSVSLQVQAGSTVSASLSMAVLRQALASAGLDLAVLSTGSATVGLSVALRAARSAAAAIDLALQAAQSASVSVNLQVQDGASASTGLEVAVQQARNTVAGVQLAIRQSSMVSASLDAVLMLQRAVSATLNTVIVAPRSISTIINLYILTNASGIGVSELVTGTTVLDRNLVARLVDALVIGRPFNRLS